MFTDRIFELRLAATREQLHLRVMALDDWAPDTSRLGPRGPLTDRMAQHRADTEPRPPRTERAW